ncbi:hypothetical protein M378DRAFT_157147 [Amanita muscaria Koide BX008]|uniref:Uncharacterized protein n=1 Tax=Amanita muscaria (strain Koide BX008) TaxID=946122 RepID=A0A0C2T255_AMAMK|nr:hypothetical protein M378DRAFT_157147 [Amanita muscaria Koide BX008]
MLQYKPPPLSRAQAAPLAYQQRNQYAKNIGNPSISTGDNNQNDFATQMRPPSRFRPANSPHNSLSQAADITTSSKFQRAADQEVKRMRTMGPPPTPTPQSLRPHRVQDARQSNNGSDRFPSVATNRFLPSSNGHVPSNPRTSNNRPPPAPLKGKPQHPSHKTINLDISGSAINPGRDNGS